MWLCLQRILRKAAEYFMGSSPGLIHLCKWVWVRAYKRRDLCPRGPITGIEKALRNKICTVEPRFNEPLCNVVLGITNDFLQPGQNYSKMYATEPRFNEITMVTRYDVVSSRWSSHFWVKVHVFQLFSTLKVKLVDRMMQSKYLCVILQVKAQKNIYFPFFLPDF